jgi:uncharacterized protein YbjT (DUF2867 family)
MNGERIAMDRISKHVVTGATGNIGSMVVERLLASGERPRVFVRDEAKARARWGDRVDVAVGDLTDGPSLATALEGADGLFLVNSGPELDRHDRLAARAAKTAGLARLVKLSSYDARQQDVGTGVWHARGEVAIRESGVTFVFVQPSGFMSNALYWASAIRSAGVVRSATGEGRIPFIHPLDIAEVATKALTTATHDGEALSITGPEALSYGEMTAKIAAAIGRPLRYEAISEEEARAQQAAWNTPAPLAEARLSIFRAIRAGRLAEVTNDVQRVLGRVPLGFDRWVDENVVAFR